tara:strand:- start:198 stop:746 length:549 start_codon:yes stop_codon:yes gene_type:complete
VTRSCTGQIIKGDILRKLYGCSSFALFSLFYGLHYVAAWLSREETLGEVAVDIVGSATLLIELLWLYQLNVDLGRYCGYRSVNTERTFLIVLVAMMLTNLLGFLTSGEPRTVGTDLWVYIALLLAASFWVSSHLAQKLVACERARALVVSTQVRTTWAFFILPIGIWFLQPRIKRLFAATGA